MALPITALQYPPPSEHCEPRRLPFWQIQLIPKSKKISPGDK